MKRDGEICPQHERFGALPTKLGKTGRGAHWFGQAEMLELNVQNITTPCLGELNQGRWRAVSYDEADPGARSWGRFPAHEDDACTVNIREAVSVTGPKWSTEGPCHYTCHIPVGRSVKATVSAMSQERSILQRTLPDLD